MFPWPQETSCQNNMLHAAATKHTMLAPNEVLTPAMWHDGLQGVPRGKGHRATSSEKAQLQPMAEKALRPE